MAKQKKKRKANPNSRPKLAEPQKIRLTVRLSQCMIVKNEEKNIARALSWAKNIVYEQIVVDTGSTDRTVEIAESMGAKVFHFEWINDFAAAKNFAIEKASGNWIAFLDADEYMSEEDSKSILDCLLKAEHPDIRDMCLALRLPWVHLDDEGKPFAITEQDRFFRNKPDIRYEGAIHEKLTIADRVYKVPELSIMHTGYAKSSYAETGKAERNLKLLREEMESRPDDPNLVLYYADSLRAMNTAENNEEAEQLYRKALASQLPMYPSLRQIAYNFVIARNIDCADEIIPMCRKAAEEFPENPDFLFYLGLMLNNQKNHYEAWEYLTRCESVLKNADAVQSQFAMMNANVLFFEMIKAADALNNKPEVIRCATLLLREDKYQAGIARPYIAALKAPGSDATDADVLTILSKLYDLTSAKDKIFLMRAAKDAGEMGLTRDIYNLLTPEELEWLSGGGDENDA